MILLSLFTALIIYIVLNELFIRFIRSTRRSYNPYKYSSYFRSIKFLVAWFLVTLQNRRNRKRHIEDEKNIVERLEKPQRLEPFGPQANDAIAFTGSDDQGNQILLRYGRRHDGIAEFWLLLRIVEEETGVVYTHPEHPNAIFLDAQQDAFAGGGLRFEVVEPMKKWKVKYNGWMRKGMRETMENSADGLLKTRFEFEWTAISDPFHFHHQLDPSLIASSMADQCWSAKFFEQLREHSARGHEVRYEQWGEITGRVTFNDDHIVEMRVKGMRDHNSGPRDWHQYNRYIAIMGMVEACGYFHIGAVSMRQGLNHLVYGYFGDHSGSLFPVQSCSIDLHSLGDDRVPPDHFTLAFSAGSNNYFLRVQVQDRIHVFNGLHWPSHSNLHFCKIQLNGKPGYCFSEFEYKNLNEREVEKNVIRDAAVFPEKIKLENLSMEERRKSTFPLGHKLGLCEELVGTRTQLISQLWRIQGHFSVPRGIVITKNAFQIDNQEGNEESKEGILKKESEEDTPMKKAHERVINEKTKDAIVVKLIRSIYDQHIQRLSKDWNHPSFTMVYSGTGTDVIERIPVNGFEQFIDAVLATQILFNTQPSSGYSFLLQETITGDISGRVWTRDPKTNDPSVMIVIISKGGRTVEYILNRTYDGHVTLKSGGAMNETVKKLASIGLQLEKEFRSLCYVEYLESDGIIYILECRLTEELPLLKIEEDIHS